MDRPSASFWSEDSRTQAIATARRAARSRAGEVVWAASGGDGAWRKSDASPPDLILLDYYLPGIRGDQLCRRIRMNIDTRGIPILMLTAEDAGGVELQGLESGADDFIFKSADPDILLLRIRTLLSKTQTQSSDSSHR